MLTETARSAQYSHDDGAPCEIIRGDQSCALLLICDHASNALPPGYGTLGLPSTEFHRHIAYDIGAAAVTRRLASHLGATAVLGRYSRLLIDLNRGQDDPTLVMKLSDGAIIPGNREADPFRDAEEFERRVAHYYLPYHRAIAGELSAIRARGQVPVILSVHSFTPVWRGTARPWHAAVLWDLDDRLARVLFDAFEREGGLTVGDNQPYPGYLRGDTLYQHGTAHGFAHALIEIRQDLIAQAPGQAEWAARLQHYLEAALVRAEMHEIRHFGSRTDKRA